MSIAMAPADQSVRVESLDPTRSFAIQAPAGSGKTELLTRRYLRLLATVERPEEILAITFTIKAAAEMRTRVLMALARARDGQAPSEPHHLETWQLARAVLAADERNGWQLERHPARLRVLTIDALNHALARQMPILSGTGSPISIATDPQALYERAALNVIEALGVPGHRYAAALERLVRHLDNDLDTFTVLLTNLLERRDHWLDLGLLHTQVAPASRDELRSRLEQALEDAIADRLARLRELLPTEVNDELVVLAAFAADQLEGSPEHPLLVCRGLRALPAGETSHLSLWQGICSLLLTDDGTWRAKVDKRHGFPPSHRPHKERITQLLDRLRSHDERHDGELLRRLREVRRLPSPAYRDEQWLILEALLEVLKLAVAELELVFRDHGAADHVAATLAARRALGSLDEPTDLALQLDYSLRHLLVDEFQDTSRSQVELLRLLTAGWTRDDGRTLFVVGDPMQSIYRFREADVGLFLKVRERGIGDIHLVPLSLSVNFRSARPLVKWVNEAFQRVLPGYDDPERGAVKFTASVAHAGALEDGAVHVHALLGGSGESRRREADLIVDLVERLRNRYPDASIAILVASRAHLAAVFPAFAARGLRANAVEIDLLKDRPIVQDLMALTRALVHLGDRTAWLAVLRAPWCGLTLEDLHALLAEVPRGREPPRVVWNVLNSDEQHEGLSPDGALRLARVRTVLAQALAERGRHSLRDWVERTWNSLGGPAVVDGAYALEDAEAFLSRLDELERAGDLEDVTRLPHEIAELFAVSATDGAVDVEVMTVHRAKGLEFDFVILPALERIPAQDERRLLRWLDSPRADDRPALLVAPIAAVEQDADPYYDWLTSIERARGLFERGRQLYVAATRARRELHLIGTAGVAITGATRGLQPPSPAAFLGLLWPIVRPAFANALARDDGTQAGSAVATGTPASLLRRLPTSWEPPVVKLDIDVPSAVLDAVQDTGTLPDFDWVSETGRHIGTLVHREIERLSRTAHRAIRTAIDYTRELAELGVPEALRAGAAKRVMGALANLLEDDRGRWLMGGSETHREAAAEFALSGIIDGTLVTGVIDRMIVDETGTRWLVDFKTSAHEGAGLDEFLRNEAERYRPQLQRYAALMRAYRPGEPVRAALYFPLLKVWREVDVGSERVQVTGDRGR